MAGDVEGRGAGEAAPLRAVTARVCSLADRVGVPRAEVFDVARLSAASGVPEGVVKALLNGRPGGERDVQTRFLQRLDLLRRTRLRPDGRRYTQREIADGAGMSRQQAGALLNGDRRPTMEHCDALQRFFGVHAGFLTAEDPEALVGALQRTERELLRRLADREGPGRGEHDREGAGRGRADREAEEGEGEHGSEDALERLLRDHGVRGIAWRAAQLPTDQHRDKVAEWLDMLLESVRRPGP
ncbi:helix-turn-helix domain-containing protein [Streptomyces chilikensis]|uniref:Helix-turn-helix transcriptional regulator n=1 Tax=Streptomyces chilikensis TaxID=1194079 RepID=A0ABV3EYI3_9ACTN